MAPTAFGTVPGDQLPAVPQFWVVALSTFYRALSAPADGINAENVGELLVLRFVLTRALVFHLLVVDHVADFFLDRAFDALASGRGLFGNGIGVFASG